MASSAGSVGSQAGSSIEIHPLMETNVRKTRRKTQRIESEDIAFDSTDRCDKQPLDLWGFEVISGICLMPMSITDEARRASLSRAVPQRRGLSLYVTSRVLHYLLNPG